MKFVAMKAHFIGFHISFIKKILEKLFNNRMC